MNLPDAANPACLMEVGWNRKQKIVVIWPRSGLYMCRTHQLRCSTLSSWSGFQPSPGWLQSSGVTSDIFWFHKVLDLDISWSLQLLNKHPKICYIRGLSSPPGTLADCICVRELQRQRETLVCVTFKLCVLGVLACQLGWASFVLVSLFFASVMCLAYHFLALVYSILLLQFPLVPTTILYWAPLETTDSIRIT